MKMSGPWELILSEVQRMYKHSPYTHMFGEVERALCQIFSKETQLIDPGGSVLDQSDLSSVQLDRILDHRVHDPAANPNGHTIDDLICQFAMRDLLGWALFNLFKMPRDISPDVEQALETIGIDRSDTWRSFEGLAETRQLADVPRRKILNHLKSKTAYWLYACETEGGFIWDRNGWATEFRDDHPHVLSHEVDDGSTIELKLDRPYREQEYLLTVEPHAIWRDADGQRIGLANFFVASPQVDFITDGDFICAMDEISDTDVHIADRLNRLYGAEDVFAEGDLLIIYMCEVRSDLRGQDKGRQFLGECLRALKGEFPGIGSVALSFKPLQYRNIRAQDLPRSIEPQYLKDWQSIRAWWGRIEDEMREILGDDHGPAEVFEYNDPQVPRNEEICRLVGSYIFDELSERDIARLFQ
jgi:hypothetical protein